MYNIHCTLLYNIHYDIAESTLSLREYRIITILRNICSYVCHMKTGLSKSAKLTLPLHYASKSFHIAIALVSYHHEP